MSLPEPLLDVLCCPVSHEPLVPLSTARLKKLNDVIAADEVLYVDHSPVKAALQAALITRDGKVIYEVNQGIPVLLPDRGIGTTQFKTPL